MSVAASFRTFGARSSADDIVAGVDLTERTMIVTGANTGIGFETSRALASAGARVILACRNVVAGATAVERIRSRHPGSRVEVGELDLASFASVRAFIDRADLPRLDALICNAGLMNSRYRESESGFEHTVGVCHLGHFLLTRGLLPKLLQRGSGRVVMVSSESHRLPPRLNFDKLPLPKKSYWGLVAYGQAKLCNVLFANELQRRYGDQGLMACSLHPGTLVTTEIGRDAAFGRIFMKLVSPLTKTPSQGAATSVLAAVHPEPEKLAGRYLSHCRPVKSTPEANDPEVAARLWAATEAWVG